MPPFPIFSQADQNQRSCLDTETGLLVNHAYGLADMKARTYAPVLTEMLLGREGPLKHLMMRVLWPCSVSDKHASLETLTLFGSAEGT